MLTAAPGRWLRSEKSTTPAALSQVALTNPPGLREVPDRSSGNQVGGLPTVTPGETLRSYGGRRTKQPYRLQLFWQPLLRPESPCERVREPYAVRSCGALWPGFPFSGQVGFVAFPSSIPFSSGLLFVLSLLCRAEHHTLRRIIVQYLFAQNALSSSDNRPQLESGGTNAFRRSQRLTSTALPQSPQRTSTA